MESGYAKEVDMWLIGVNKNTRKNWKTKMLKLKNIIFGSYTYLFLSEIFKKGFEIASYT